MKVGKKILLKIKTLKTPVLQQIKKKYLPTLILLEMRKLRFTAR